MKALRESAICASQRSTELRHSSTGSPTAQLPRGSAERSPSKPHAEVSASLSLGLAIFLIDFVYEANAQVKL